MADYKLNGANLQYVADNFIALTKVGPSGNMTMIFTAASNASREKLVQIFTSLYNVKSTRYGDGFGSIILQFNNPSDGDEFYRDVLGAVSQYMEAHPNVTPENNYNNHLADDMGGNEQTLDWTTYLIIGAAAVAILILLWPKKRK